MPGPVSDAYDPEGVEGCRLKEAEPELPELGRFPIGDLDVVNRGNCGLDFYNRFSGEKKTFLTVGGELRLLEYLQEKYPSGRQSSNVPSSLRR